MLNLQSMEAYNIQGLKSYRRPGLLPGCLEAAVYRSRLVVALDELGKV